jgi:hypothetical protein
MRVSPVLSALLLLVAASAAHAGVGLVPVLGGLSQPTFVTHAGDGSGRLFIVEQPGRIKVLQPGTSTPTVFLDITPIVRSPTSGGGDEQGLLSVAFHPNYASIGFFYVYGPPDQLLRRGRKWGAVRGGPRNHELERQRPALRRLAGPGAPGRSQSPPRLPYPATP